MLDIAIAKLDEVRKQKGVNIDGKNYLLVKDRIEIFRKFFALEYGIDTELVHMTSATVVVCAKITKGGEVLSSGHGYVQIGSDAFNAAAPVEIAETSAIGRALAGLGLSGGEFASADEISKTKANKPEPAAVQIDPDVYTPKVGYEEELSETLDKIDTQLQKLTTHEKRARYWSYIKPFRAWLNANEPELYETLKRIATHANRSENE